MECNYIDDCITEFLSSDNFNTRYRISSELKLKRNDRIPVIVGRKSITDPRIKKFKFLLPKVMTLGEFICQLRLKLLETDSQNALFFFVQNNTIPATTLTFGELYDKYALTDGFLYLVYSSENVFGSV
jgi:GABA(A) receptor-associated protein